MTYILMTGVPTDDGAAVKVNHFQAALELNGIVDRLEALQYDPTKKIYECTKNIIEKYFIVHEPFE